MIFLCKLMIDTCTIYNSIVLHSIDQNQLQLSLPSKAQKTTSTSTQLKKRRSDGVNFGSSHDELLYKYISIVHTHTSAPTNWVGGVLFLTRIIAHSPPIKVRLSVSEPTRAPKTTTFDGPKTATFDGPKTHRASWQFNSVSSTTVFS